jgi:hypothetical protein
MSGRWLIVNGEVSYKNMINCTNVVELITTEEYFYKLDVNEEIKLVRCSLE